MARDPVPVVGEVGRAVATATGLDGLGPRDGLAHAAAEAGGAHWNLLPVLCLEPNRKDG